MFQTLGFISGLFITFGFMRLLYVTWFETARPAGTSWVIWSVEGAIFLAAYSYTGAEATLATAWVYFLGPVFVLLAMWRTKQRTMTNGSLRAMIVSWDWKWHDGCCFIATLLSIAPWLMLHDPVWSVFALITIDAAATLPTVRNIRAEPHREDMGAWCFFLAGDSAAFFAALYAMHQLDVEHAAEVYYASALILCSMTVILTSIVCRIPVRAAVLQRA